jgi:hypothetical protein
MPIRVHTSRALELKSLSRTIKPVDDDAKGSGITERVAVGSTGNDEVSFVELTLDDFGGRSDALGG